MKHSHNSTMDKILSSAAELFSERGYHGTSVRDVTLKANVNLASINYHFGDKQRLYREVIANRLRPLNRTRVDKLASARALAGDQPIPLTLIIDIFARPLFELNEKSDPQANHVLRMIARSMVEPLAFMDEFLGEELHSVTVHFSQAIRRHLPALSPEEFMWRLNFVVGAMHHTLATMHRMKELTHGLCKNDDPESALRHFSEFAVSNLTANIAFIEESPNPPTA